MYTQIIADIQAKMDNKQNLKGICENMKIKIRNNKPPPLHEKYDKTWSDISCTNGTII